MFEGLPRKKLAHLPTPLHRLPNLADTLGIDELWIKRDDLTGRSIGGNKTRKLEFVIGDALAQGADTIVTVGGVQSNHCRQTAAAAAIVGMRCILLLAGEEPEISTGNLLLDKLYGAEIKYFPDANVLDMNLHLEGIMETLRDFGLTPYAIPVGAALPVGTIGYAQAMFELKQQIEETGFSPDKIFVAAGTGGTLAGMVLGAHVAGVDAEIIGVSVLSPAETLVERTRDLVQRTVDSYPQLFEKFDPTITVDDSFVGKGYGFVSDGVKSAIEMFAKMDAVLLDPIYTAKAGLALMRMALAGDIERSANVLFWHTGGSPEIFTHAGEFFM